MNKKDKTLYFIERANKIHNNKYDYSLTQYIYAKDKVVIKCNEHGIFEQTAINHLRGHGCKVCGKIKERRNVNENKLREKFQNIIQPEDYKIIPLTNNEVVFVDNCDFDKVKDINWHNNGLGYARNDKFGYMHRYILNVDDSLQVDHKNRNTFDNRRENIRVVSSMENNWNTSPVKNSNSIYKGVQKLPSGNWTAIIVSNSIKNYIGTFSDEVEAAKAVDIASLKERGEFAYLNFPELKDEYLKNAR